MEELIVKILDAAADLFNHLWGLNYSWMEKEIFGVSCVDILAFIVMILIIKIVFQIIKVRVNRILGISSRRR